jgi:hypothetical protein
VTDGPLMGAHEPSPEKRNHAVDARQQLGGGLQVFVELGDLMHKALGGCAALAPPSVRVYYGARFNSVPQEGTKAFGRRIRDLTHADPPDSLPIFLSCHHN